MMATQDLSQHTGRSPYGERGLKSSAVWCQCHSGRRSPYGERGLKYPPVIPATFGPSRSPYGERGLKSMSTQFVLVYEKSLSLRRAWIEIIKEQW